MTKKTAFWIFLLGTLSSTIVFLGLTFGVAGVLQSRVERVLGLGYMTAQGYMRLRMGVTLLVGVVFLGGLLTAVVDFFTLRPARADA
jgi:nitric oxide reductase subunit B